MIGRILRYVFGAPWRPPRACRAGPGYRLEAREDMTHVYLILVDARGRETTRKLTPFEAAALAADLGHLARLTGRSWAVGESRPAE